MKNKIIIIAGDPNSVNSEIIFKAWKKSSNKIKNKIVIIGSHSLLKDQAKKLKINIKLSVIEDIDKNPTTGIQEHLGYEWVKSEKMEAQCLDYLKPHIQWARKYLGDA